MKKDKLQILQRIRMRAESKRRREKNRRSRHGVCNRNVYNFNQISMSTQKQNYIRELLPPTLKYLTDKQDCPFSLNDIRKKVASTNGYIEMPSDFSIIDNPEESYDTLRKIIRALLIDDIKELILDYKSCKNIELSTLVLHEIILRDYMSFKRRCRNTHRNKKDIFPNFKGKNTNNSKEISELLWSVGIASILGTEKIKFENVVPYPLRIHSIEKNSNENKRMEQKELDTTELVEYVIECLNKMGKRLTPQKREALCTIIGEILINAEEHSTEKRRFSIGFFREVNDNKHHGLFRLVILNFGRTIYEKFKSEDCPNQPIVNQMQELSRKYTRRLLFLPGSFEEESLWTLYALQEGVTSVSKDSYKRGNGSINFIESFFSIKGNNKQDSVSKMTLLSGKTKIRFDGKYAIAEKINGTERFKVMTFNSEGNIESKPDSDCVCQTNYYFPGTMLSVKLLFNEDDIQ